MIANGRRERFEDDEGMAPTAYGYAYAGTRKQRKAARSEAEAHHCLVTLVARSPLATR